jgi:hypothetical protein
MEAASIAGAFRLAISAVVMFVILGMTEKEIKSFTQDVGNTEDLLYDVQVMLNGKLRGNYTGNSKIRGLSFENNPSFLNRNVCKTIGKYYTWVDNGAYSANEIGYEIRFHAILYYGGSDYVQKNFPDFATNIGNQFGTTFDDFVSWAVADVTIGGEWEATTKILGISLMGWMHTIGNLIPNGVAQLIYDNYYL